MTGEMPRASAARRLDVTNTFEPMAASVSAHKGAEHRWEPRRGGSVSSCAGCALSVIAPPPAAAARFGGHWPSDPPDPPPATPAAMAA